MLNHLHNKFFKGIFLSYLIVIAVISMFCLVFFQYQRYMAKQRHEIQECHNRVALMSRTIDDKFTEAEIIGAQIANSSWLNYAGSKSDIMKSRIDYFKRQEICETIGNENDLFRIAKSTAVILPRNNLAMDKVSFWECSRYFESVGLYPEVLDEIINILRENYSNQVLYRAEKSTFQNSNFMIVKQLEYSDEPKQLVFFLIDGKFFGNYIKSNFSGIQSFDITTGNRSIFRYSIKLRPEQKIYRETIRSSLYNWSYTFDIGIEYTNKFFNFYFISGYIVLMISVVILSYLLTKLSYRPISILAGKLGISKKKEELYSLDDIESSFQDLRGINQKLHLLSSQYYTIAKNIFLSNLLQGSFTAEKVINYIIKFDLNFTNQMDYMVVLLNFLGDRDKDGFYKDLLELHQWNNLADAPVVMDESSQTYIFILSSVSGNDDLISQSNKIKKSIDEQIPDSQLEIIYGQPHKGLEGINKSYKEAKKKLLPENILKQDAYYYPLDQEIKLINYMKINNFDAANKVFREIMKENLKRNLTKEENLKVTALISEMLYRYANDLGICISKTKTGFEEIRETDDLESPWICIQGILNDISQIYNQNQKINSLGNEIVTYVNENFQNADLSQQDIADLFHVSRPTISKIFKETTKVNFIDYLHKLRIEQAKKLFDAGKTDILEVAKKTGYDNEITFKRAFRKNEAVTPREYTRMIRNL